jgi:hypothetical protein
LYSLGRVPAVWLGFASMDSTWLVLFIVAFVWRGKRKICTLLLDSWAFCRV